MHDILSLLETLFPGRVTAPTNVDAIPAHVPLVYILTWDGRPIVVGKGTRERARVIFDDAEHITRPHLKSLFVRLWHLYGGNAARVARYLVRCESDVEAKAAEKQLHREIGGNRRKVDSTVQAALFAGLRADTIPWLLLNQALASSFDGQDDLYRWRRQGLIHEHDWAVVRQRLRLP